MARSCCQTLRKRMKDIRSIHTAYSWFYITMGFTIVFAIGVSLGVKIGQIHYGGDESDRDVIVEAAGIVVAEALSVTVTVFVVNRWYDKRQRTDLQNQLLREVGSGSNEFAKNAVSRLRAEGWLTGANGLLQLRELNHSNLRNAHLRDANINNAKLVRASLKNADLVNANLASSVLFGADLRGAQLQGANLRAADLRCADLRDAQFKGRHLSEEQAKGADLQAPAPGSACLNDANLEGALLEGAILPDERYLVAVQQWPDGEHYYNVADLEKFTDADNPDFPKTLKDVKRYRRASRYFAVGEVYAVRD